MQFHPLHNRVGIKRIDAEEKPAGGIIIPDTAKEKPPQGENNTNHSAPALAYQPKRLEKLASIAVVRKCHRGQEICSQGQPAEYWYRGLPARRGDAWRSPMVGAKLWSCCCLRLYRPHRV